MFDRGKIDYSQIRDTARNGTGNQIQMFGGGSTKNGNAAVFNDVGDVVDGGVTPGGGTGTGGGTVTSVALTMPGEFTVGGSPITAAGTLAVAKASQPQNTVYAGPSSGSGPPVFRVLVAADLPSGTASAVSSVFNRKGDVVAVAGDYTAAMVTNAVSTASSYSNPSWIASLAWGKITGAPSPYSLPAATATLLGGVKVGANISVAGDGTISVAPPSGGSYTLPPATASILGGVKIGANVSVAADGTISVAPPSGGSYTLPPATVTILGGVKVGANVGVSADGTISVAAPYALSAATTTLLGGVKIGANVSVAADGTISVAAPGSAYTLPAATAALLGGVKIGANVNVAADGTISVAAPGAGSQSPWTGNIDAANHQLLNLAGPLGISNASPAYALDVAGDVNCTGVFRVNGVAISAGGAVVSVFNRTGAVVAAAGDYTAAMVTDAVSTISSYSNPVWISSLAWNKITGAPAPYSLSPATASLLGGVKIGANVSVAADGTISVAAPVGSTPWASEVPSGTIDGSNAVFTLSGTPGPSALMLTLNGIAQNPGTDYTLSGKTITYTVAPRTGNWHVAWYGNASAAGSGGPQTPWASDINAANYSLKNLASLQFGPSGSQFVLDTRFSQPELRPSGTGPVGLQLFPGDDASGTTLSLYNATSAADRIFLTSKSDSPGTAGLLVYASSASAAHITRLSIGNYTPATGAGITGIDFVFGANTPMASILPVGTFLSGASGTNLAFETNGNTAYINGQGDSLFNTVTTKNLLINVPSGQQTGMTITPADSTAIPMVQLYYGGTSKRMGMYWQQAGLGDVWCDDTLQVFGAGLTLGAQTSTLAIQCPNSYVQLQTGSSLLARVVVSNAGNVTINKPDSGIPLTVNGQVQSTTPSGGPQYGLVVRAPDTSTYPGISVYDGSGNSLALQWSQYGYGSVVCSTHDFWLLGYGGAINFYASTTFNVQTSGNSGNANRFTVGNAGNVVVGAPDSGVPLTVAGLGGYGVSVTGNGAFIGDSTGATHNTFQNSDNAFRVLNNGSIVATSLSTGGALSGGSLTIKPAAANNWGNASVFPSSNGYGAQIFAYNGVDPNNCSSLAMFAGSEGGSDAGLYVIHSGTPTNPISRMEIGETNQGKITGIDFIFAGVAQASVLSNGAFYSKATGSVLAFSTPSNTAAITGAGAALFGNIKVGAYTTSFVNTLYVDCYTGGATPVSRIFGSGGTAAGYGALQLGLLSGDGSGAVLGAYITATGVGIRTSTPAYALDVAGDCNITGTFRVNGTAIGTGGAPQTPWTSNINANNFNLNNVPSITVQQGSSASAGTRMWQASATYPTLYVMGHGASYTSFYLYSGDTVSTGYSNITLGNSTDATNAGVMVIQSSNSGIASLLTNSYGTPAAPITKFQIGGSGSALAEIDFTFNAMTRAVITSVGNVGIGNAAPGYPLDVTGDVHATGYVRSFNAAYGTAGFECGLQNSLGINLYYNGSNWVYRAAGPAMMFWASTGASNNVINLYTCPGGSAGAIAPLTATMILVPGAVGINGVSPSASLDVAGNARVLTGSGIPALNVGANGNIDGGAYAAVNITRETTGHVGSHLAFIRAGTTVAGIGHGQSSSSFGIGAGTTGAFTPNWLTFLTNGNAGFGTTAPNEVVSIIAPNQTTLATANQFAIGEQSNNVAYRLQLGFAAVPNWSGVIQATAGGPSGGLLLLQPAGGLCGIGGSKQPAYAVDVTGDVNVTGAYRVNGTPIVTGGGAGKTFQQVFTASGTFTPSAALLAAGGTVFVFMVGGGGGGGAPNAVNGGVYGGGGGGGGVLKRWTTVNGATAVTVGGGGAGGYYAAGAAGGTTSFGSLSVTGGGPGAGGVNVQTGLGGNSGNSPFVTPGANYSGGAGAGGPAGPATVAPGGNVAGGCGGPGIDGYGGGGGFGGTSGNTYSYHSLGGPGGGSAQTTINAVANSGGGGGGLGVSGYGGNGGSGIVIVTWSE